MATHGHVGEFTGDSDDWTAYAERLEHYFTANEVKTAAKKRAVLLSCCGATTYKLIRNLTAPGKATDFTFEEIVKKVKEHHCPKPSQIAQRFKFNTRVQGATESISEFVAELRSIATYCEFKDATITEMMRDRLVCGVRDKRLQQRLLAEPDNVAFDTEGTKVSTVI